VFFKKGRGAMKFSFDVRDLILLFFLSYTSMAYAEVATDVQLWGEPKPAKFVAQESAAPDSTAIISKNISLIFNVSSISLQRDSNQLAGNLIFDAYFPYKQIPGKKVPYAALDLRYHFIGDKHTGAKLLVFVNGKLMSQNEILSSDVSKLKRISKVKLDGDGAMRVTIICLVQRNSYQEDAACTFDTLDIYDAAGKK
jgi:hypothetical protein